MGIRNPASFHRNHSFPINLADINQGYSTFLRCFGMCEQDSIFTHSNKVSVFLGSRVSVQVSKTRVLIGLWLLLLMLGGEGVGI